MALDFKIKCLNNVIKKSPLNQRNFLKAAAKVFSFAIGALNYFRLRD